MSSSAKYAKYDSAVDSIISIIRRSYFGKKVDEEFLTDLKSLMENKIVATGVMEQATDPMKSVSVLNTELECLPLPNEILVKIFGYLDIQDISRSARVSHQFNMISKDTSLWKSLGKLRIDERKVPTEFLAYVIQRGITELSLYQCEILPLKLRLTQPLNLKSLSLHETDGDETIVNELLTSQHLERIDFRETGESDFISENDISQFIKKLPQIGSRLKNLSLECKLGKYGDLGTIALIVNTCLGLEELNLSRNTLSEDAIDYLCENLTPNIVQLNLELGEMYGEPDKGLNDNNIRALVKRCPNLKVLDVRSNQKMTYKGLVAIIDGLHSLEILGLPDSVGDELGFPDNVNLSKLHRLKSMKKLKELLIEENDYRSIFEKENSPIREHTGGQVTGAGCDFEVAMADINDFRDVQFCPNCLEYTKAARHEC